jgi:hypothetical protein
MSEVKFLSNDPLSAEALGGVSVSKIFSAYLTSGAEIIGDYILLGQLSYNAKIKHLFLTATLSTITADIVLLDDQGNEMTEKIAGGITLTSLTRAEQTTVAQNVLSLEEIVVSNTGYQATYRVALKFAKNSVTVNSLVYSELEFIDNV